MSVQIPVAPAHYATVLVTQYTKESEFTGIHIFIELYQGKGDSFPSTGIFFRAAVNTGYYPR